MFAYSPSRSTEGLPSGYMLACAPAAVLMSDGYEVYSKIARAHRLVHLGCWAHARRYFHDAVQALPKNSRGPQQVAVRFIDLIANLYQVESLAKEAGLNHEGLKLRRQTHSKLVLKDIEELLLANLHAVLPGSLLGKALHYMSSQWTKLATYVEDGRYPIRQQRLREFDPSICRWGAATGYSRTQWPVPTPARTCTRCWRPARPTASTAIGTSEPCWWRCHWPRLPTTSTRYCPGTLRCRSPD